MARLLIALAAALALSACSKPIPDPYEYRLECFISNAKTFESPPSNVRPSLDDAEWELRMRTSEGWVVTQGNYRPSLGEVCMIRVEEIESGPVP